jgi:predicted HD phosphohydrolase
VSTRPLHFRDAEDLLAFLAAAASTPSEEGLAMSELDHGLQTADVLRTLAPDDVELHVAGLVHDVGHAFATGLAGGSRRTMEHEHGRLGAEAVRHVLGARIATLVEAHVDAKRYLVAVDTEYAAALSPGSVHSLALQGGPLDDVAVARCDALPHWREAVLLRRADDRAKQPGRVVPELDAYEAAIFGIAARA